MERILEELKKIEDESEKIRLEASKKAEEIIKLARQRSEKLVTDAEKDAERTIDKLMENFRNRMKKRHNELMSSCELEIAKLRNIAEKNMDLAVNQIFKAVIGEKES